MTHDDLACYYAASTGALRQGLSNIEMRLRLALKTQRTEAGLRRELVDVLGIIERDRADQHQRDVAAGNARSEAA